MIQVGFLGDCLAAPGARLGWGAQADRDSSQEAFATSWEVALGEVPAQDVVRSSGSGSLWVLDQLPVGCGRQGAWGGMLL